MEPMLEPRLGLFALLAMAAGLFVGYEACYRIGKLRPEELRDAKKAQADVAVAALLALLGLLLAFSFEIGETRYDKRKQLVLEEGNAIETTYRRAATLPAPHDERMQAMLREYVHARIGLETPEDIERALRQSGALHGRLWAEATEAARDTPTAVVSVFLVSLNEMIDLQAARLTVGLYQRIPAAIFTILYVVALLSMSMVGLRAGIDRARGLMSATVLVAAIMSVIALIASLDAPMSRLFEINKHAIAHAQELMSKRTASSTTP